VLATWVGAKHDICINQRGAAREITYIWRKRDARPGAQSVRMRPLCLALRLPPRDAIGAPAPPPPSASLGIFVPMDPTIQTRRCARAFSQKPRERGKQGEKSLDRLTDFHHRETRPPGASPICLSKFGARQIRMASTVASVTRESYTHVLLSQTLAQESRISASQSPPFARALGVARPDWLTDRALTSRTQQVPPTNQKVKNSYSSENQGRKTVTIFTVAKLDSS
jgi:hypothetical protein